MQLVAKKESVATEPPSSPPEKDYAVYTRVAIEYAHECIADTNYSTHGKLMVRAAERFLKDLERTKELHPPFLFIDKQAWRFCRFIEMLPHVEGKWATKTITLIPEQVFFLVNLFGFRDPTGSRRFSTALYAVARKNAKSTLAAAILIACICLEDEPGPQVISAATTGKQARIVWDVVKKMVEKSPKIRNHYRLRPRCNDVQCDGPNGGTIKPINSKASTQDGLNPSCTNLDELHAHQTHDLLNVLMSAAGARRNPLWLYTTTEGYENPGPWAEQRDFAEQVLNGVVEADHYFACIFRIDDEDDDFDETKWVKANPLMRTNELLLKETRKLAIEAKSMPGRLSEFRIKRLNRRASNAFGWIDLLKWRACGGKVDLEAMRKYECWAALDMAANIDMAALRFLWRIEENKFATWGRYWVPEAMVKKMTERGTVPYQGWVDSHWLKATPGNSISYAIVKEDVIADCAKFNPKSVGYDSWNANQLALELTEADIPMIQFVQGTKSFNPAMKSFERAYLETNIVHEQSPILTWNMANVVASLDANQNMKPDRNKSKSKIDGAVCLFMCFGLMEVDNDSYVQGRLVKA